MKPIYHKIDPRKITDKKFEKKTGFKAIDKIWDELYNNITSRVTYGIMSYIHFNHLRRQ
jgi:hypothetical protein